MNKGSLYEIYKFKTDLKFELNASNYHLTKQYDLIPNVLLCIRWLG